MPQLWQKILAKKGLKQRKIKQYKKNKQKMRGKFHAFLFIRVFNITLLSTINNVAKAFHIGTAIHKVQAVFMQLLKIFNPIRNILLLFLNYCSI
jgi:hypothetical protein